MYNTLGPKCANQYQYHLRQINGQPDYLNACYLLKQRVLLIPDSWRFKLKPRDPGPGKSLEKSQTFFVLSSQLFIRWKRLQRNKVRLKQSMLLLATGLIKSTLWTALSRDTDSALYFYFHY